MKERTSSFITIHRVTFPDVSVPITRECKRRFKLMQEDSLELAFTLPQAEVFPVGSFVVDEVFGRFFICELQQPTYNSNTGGYDYRLIFKADYWLFNNKTVMLVTRLGDGRLLRKESIWTNAHNLKQQLEAIMSNLEPLGYSGWGYNVHEDTATQWAEVKVMAYNGTHFIDALNMLAEQWECEWWVENKTFHFGKCITDDEPIEIAEGINVQSMKVQNDRQTYANKIYLYGSKDNIPVTYRKKMYMEFVDTIIRDGIKHYIPNRKLTARMFASVEEEGTPYTLGAFRNAEYNESVRRNQCISQSINIDRKQAINIKLDTVLRIVYTEKNDYGAFVPFTTTVNVYLVKGNTIIKNLNQGGFVDHVDDVSFYQYACDNARRNIALNIDEKIVLDKGVYHIMITYETRLDYGYEFGHMGQNGDYNSIYMDTLLAQQIADAVYLTVLTQASDIKINYTLNGVGKEAYAVLNPTAQTGTVYPSEEYGIVFVNEYGEYVDNQDFCTTKQQVEGKTCKFVLDDEGSIAFPDAYYTNDYSDPSSLARLGEARLLPPEGEYELDEQGNIVSTGGAYVCRNGYLMRKEQIPEDGIVELAVAFNKIYPDGKLRVSNVIEQPRYLTQDFEDGSKTNWNYTQFTLELQTHEGAPFIFKQKYILEGKELKMRFLTPQDLANTYPDEVLAADMQNGCKLAGMTFGVHFNETAGDGLPSNSHTIVRNEDFGAKLPSDVLHPTLLDPVTLVNWNVRAMAGMGLIEDAERRLLKAGVGYMKAINENQYTVDCSMMTDFSIDLVKNIAFYTADNIPFLDAMNRLFMVKESESYYILLQAGTPIKVVNDAFAGGEMNSRVMGYEFALDKPYDTPIYTIGETQAYSRLAKIEKDITKIS